MHDALSAEEQHYLEQARALIPVLAERSAATTAARDVVPETIADFHRLGILRIIQPRRFGGLQLRFSQRFRCRHKSTSGAMTRTRWHRRRWHRAQPPNAMLAAGD
jgi:hypothetical protein